VCVFVSPSVGRGGSIDASSKAPMSHMTRTSSIQSINHISLKLTKSDCPPDDDRSNYNHTKSTATPERLRRTTTISDINSCIALDENLAPVAPVKFVVRREGDEKTEELKKDFLVVVAGSLLAGTSLTELANQRVSPGGSLSWEQSKKLDVCMLDSDAGGGAADPPTFKWRQHSVCLDKMAATTELKDMKMQCKRECVSEGCCGDDGGREVTHLWGKDFNLGEECFAEIERRTTDFQLGIRLQEGGATAATATSGFSNLGKAVEDGAAASSED